MPLGFFLWMLRNHHRIIQATSITTLAQIIFLIPFKSPKASASQSYLVGGGTGFPIEVSGRGPIASSLFPTNRKEMVVR